MSMQVPFYKVVPTPNLPESKIKQDTQLGQGDAFSNILRDTASRLDPNLLDQKTLTGEFATEIEDLHSTLGGEVDLDGDTTNFTTLGVLLRRLLRHIDSAEFVQDAGLTLEQSDAESLNEEFLVDPAVADSFLSSSFVARTVDDVPEAEKLDAAKTTALIQSLSVFGPATQSFTMPNIGQLNGQALKGVGPTQSIAQSAKPKASVVRPPVSEALDKSQLVRAERMASLDGGIDDAGADVDISLSRGENGLIIVIKLDWADPKRLKQLEDRLTRLVESEGERVEHLDVQIPKRSFANYISEERKGSKHGTD